MAQLMLNPEIVDSPDLRRHIAERIEEIETVLPEGASLKVHLKRVSRHLFGARLHSRLFGREVVVRVYDANIFHALNRARRHLLRQVDDVRHEKRDRIRLRHAKGRIS